MATSTSTATAAELEGDGVVEYAHSIVLWKVTMLLSVALIGCALMVASAKKQV